MIGEHVGHYRILEKLGSGGMGEVWLAEDTRLERRVAIKFLPYHAAQDEVEKARFIQEAKAAAKLSHSNIAQVFEIDEEDGRLYIVMEHVEGGSLSDRLKEAKGRSLPLEDVLSWTRQAAEGLAEAHRNGIIHRDIKPDNLMLTAAGQLKIMDFGLARIDTATRLTTSGATLGTVNYMSPEQVVGKSVDHRTDLFSLGATLYELLSGHKAFEGDDANSAYYSILNEPVEPLSRFVRELPEGLEELAGKLLEKDPNLRYQSAAEVATDIQRIISGVSSRILAPKPVISIRERLKQVSRRTWLILGLIIIALALFQIPQVAVTRQLSQYILFEYIGGPFKGLTLIRNRVLNKLERRKQVGDREAYITSALMGEEPEKDLEAALGLSPTDPRLLSLSAQIRFQEQGVEDSLGIVCAERAMEYEPDNGANAFLLFVSRQLTGSEEESDRLLSRAIESPRFELGWSEFYASAYRSLDALDMLTPAWQDLLDLPWFPAFRTAPAVYLGKSDFRQDHRERSFEGDELIRRGARIEALGYRLMQDETGLFLQFLVGRSIVNEGLQAQLESLPENHPDRTSIQLRLNALQYVSDIFRERIRNDWNRHIDILHSSNYPLGFFYLSILLLIWTILFRYTYSSYIKRSQIRQSRSSEYQTNLLPWLLFGLYLTVVFFEITLLYSGLFLATVWNGSTLVIPPLFIYVLISILSKRFRDIITKNASRWLSSMTLIAVFLILLSAVIFASQALTIAPDLEKLLDTPNPSLSADLINF